MKRLCHSRSETSQTHAASTAPGCASVSLGTALRSGLCSSMLRLLALGVHRRRGHCRLSHQKSRVLRRRGHRPCLAFSLDESAESVGRQLSIVGHHLRLLGLLHLQDLHLMPLVQQLLLLLKVHLLELILEELVVLLLSLQRHLDLLDGAWRLRCLQLMDLRRRSSLRRSRLLCPCCRDRFDDLCDDRACSGASARGCAHG